MSANPLDFNCVMSTFQTYLAKDDCVEFIKTTRCYAVIEWDNRLSCWTEIEHCPSTAALQDNLQNHMVSLLEYGYTLVTEN